MARNNSKTADEVQIRQLIDCWACAIRDKNIQAAVSHYARDILLYDLAPPLVHRGVDPPVERGGGVASALWRSGAGRLQLRCD
jgi:ketosteroid isomerase-like protein